MQCDLVFSLCKTNGLFSLVSVMSHLWDARSLSLSPSAGSVSDPRLCILGWQQPVALGSTHWQGAQQSPSTHWGLANGSHMWTDSPTFFQAPGPEANSDSMSFPANLQGFCSSGSQPPMDLLTPFMTECKTKHPMPSVWAALRPANRSSVAKGSGRLSVCPSGQGRGMVFKQHLKVLYDK